MNKNAKKLFGGQKLCAFLQKYGPLGGNCFSKTILTKNIKNNVEKQFLTYLILCEIGFEIFLNDREMIGNEVI